LKAEADIPRLVRELRKRTALTQEKFAARLGVTFPTINRWENGHAKPSPLALKQLEILLHDLGDDAQDLLREHFGQEGRDDRRRASDESGLLPEGCTPPMTPSR
jgi:transcriptional regulator with XRE-family HTH domain